MRMCGRAEELVKSIIDTFSRGNLPKALAPLFLDCDKNVPARKWSWGNRLLVALAGSTDSRTMNQWNAVGRHVKRGEKAHYILAPFVVKAKDDLDENGRPRERLIGFRSLPVFGFEQTEGKPLPERESSERFLGSLPLREVAEAWGLQIQAYSGGRNRPAGWYAPHSNAIALGVENLSTWAHELVHAADDRLGNLTETGQHWRSEIVAELGGATLLHALDLPSDADVGGAWQYIESYARQAKVSPISACLSVIDRICKSVDHILNTAEQLREKQSQKAA